VTPANDNQPRLITKKAAAAYCGVTSVTFGKWVLSGMMPPPYRATRMYDRKAIDAALDKDSGLGVSIDTEDPFDRWEREQAAKTAAGRR
jgi:hypothetical protein